MGTSTLTERSAPAELIEAPGTTTHSDGVGIRFLDALRNGDDDGALEVCGDTTTVTAANMGWSCQGREEIGVMLVEVRRCFPGLTVEPRTRHVGFGVAIDEVRAQDLLPESAERDDHADPETTDGEPVDVPVSTQRTLSVWHEDFVTPTRLNMPVRITVRHDDLQVHEVSLSFPAALLKRALGQPVDPLELSLSEVQSAFIAPVGTGLTTRALAGPELTSTAPTSPDESHATGTERPRRRRRRSLVTALVLLVALVGAGGWWFLQGRTSGSQAGAGSGVSSRPAASPSPSAQASASASAQPTGHSSAAPTVTQAKPSSAPTRKPNITLKSDLAFAFDSATLSPQAKQAVDGVARQVRDAGLTGRIYVDGYTDNLGSAAYGVQLSQRRANAVAHYLGSRLTGVDVTIVSIGHGEQDPVASNSTPQGRIANRRVTITLPRP